MLDVKSILSEPKNTEREILEAIQNFLDLKGKYPRLESEQWDHRKSLYNILHYSKNGSPKPIYINMCHIRHKADDGFGGITMYIPHDEEERSGYTQVGINHSGFTYDGDTYISDLSERVKDGFYKVDTVTGLRIMMQHGLMLITAENFSSLLCSTKDLDGRHINEDCVNVNIGRFYKK